MVGRIARSRGGRESKRGCLFEKGELKAQEVTSIIQVDSSSFAGAIINAGKHHKIKQASEGLQEASR